MFFLSLLRTRRGADRIKRCRESSGVAAEVLGTPLLEALAVIWAHVKIEGLQRVGDFLSIIGLGFMVVPCTLMVIALNVEYIQGTEDALCLSIIGNFSLHNRTARSLLDLAQTFALCHETRELYQATKANPVCCSLSADLRPDSRHSGSPVEGPRAPANLGHRERTWKLMVSGVQLYMSFNS